MRRVPLVPATGRSAGEPLAVNLLGVFEVRLGNRVVDVARGRMRALLAILALSAGRAVSIGVIADRLWGSSGPLHPRAAVHTTVRRLRGVLGVDLVHTRADGYLLDIAPERVDALRFEQLVRLARDQEPADALATLGAAIALWRGEPLSDLDTGSPADGYRAALTARYHDAIELRAELELDRRRYDSAIPELRRLTGMDPLRESAWRRLMLALVAVGRPAEALDCYTRMREELRRSLGREPSPESRDVHETILGAPNTAAPITALGPETRSPRQLPADTGVFVGRAPELAALDALLDATSPALPLIVVIDGAAGTGKSTLATRWAHQVRDRFAGDLYADLRGQAGTTPPDRVLATFLRALGLPAERIPDGVAQRSAVLRSLLDPRPMLMVLDDASDAEQVRPLLPGSGVVLVTSRNQLRGLATREGARRVTLDAFEHADAVALLAETIGAARADADPDAVAELAELCGRLPLALRMLGERVRQRRAPLASIAVELRDERTRLNALADPDDPAVDLRALLSWSCRGLDEDTAALFGRLALHPAAELDLPTATTLAGGSPSTTAARLDRLVAAHLVEQPRPDRYRFHDLLKAYAAESIAGSL
ncbi:AfsR/SARP family transcriptional regulator [Labedaea rhizosphaerae]|uniref:DNA-binding SARP family transcriptional activator n=1 Tax=Labedaea rhizosphaerae TaxID=598644 RepID=A0A4R6S2R2_LABRH|nr:BTAD domain-containing putative transcriptional regulator [Labedaea rhizosphaerae]TDP92945.1 DNA-binding SARP family transcriptional activator [Labedaea rhizosphaerae]